MKFGHYETPATRAREDFALREDGKPQTIAYFSRESGLPLRIGLLVDTSRSQTGVIESERMASRAFFDAHFDTQVGVLQGFTSSREELDAALDRLRIPGAAATLLYEAIPVRRFIAGRSASNGTNYSLGRTFALSIFPSGPSQIL